MAWCLIAPRHNLNQRWRIIYEVVWHSAGGDISKYQPPKCLFFNLNDDVIKWKHFQRYWPFVRRNHRSAVVSLHKGQLRGALIFSLICAWTNSLANNRDAGDLRRHRGHYNVIVMTQLKSRPHLWTDELCGFLLRRALGFGWAICEDGLSAATTWVNQS